MLLCPSQVLRHHSPNEGEVCVHQATSQTGDWCGMAHVFHRQLTSVNWTGKFIGTPQ